MPPPTRARLEEQVVELVPIAARICERYREQYPDEEGRYGEAGMEWCRHDNQHILNWAIGAAAGYVDFGREIAWLARVLGARDFPLDRLAHDLEMAAEEVEDLPAVAAILREGAGTVRAG
jgi:hypothetical protein